MKLDVVFREQKQSFDAQFEAINNVSDGGYERGYADGYNKGKQDGYSDGYNVGFPEGRAEGLAAGIEQGYADGYAKGFEVGYAEGYATGYAKGKAEGGAVAVEEKDVNFYDYDGTCLYAYTIAEAQALTELPPLPKHDGLICQGWNWSSLNQGQQKKILKKKAVKTLFDRYGVQYGA